MKEEETDVNKLLENIRHYPSPMFEFIKVIK